MAVATELICVSNRATMDTLRFSHMWCAGGVDGYRQRQIAIADP
jgi:hypothetical protein